VARLSTPRNSGMQNLNLRLPFNDYKKTQLRDSHSRQASSGLAHCILAECDKQTFYGGHIFCRSTGESTSNHNLTPTTSHLITKNHTSFQCHQSARCTMTVLTKFPSKRLVHQSPKDAWFILEVQCKGESSLQGRKHVVTSLWGQTTVTRRGEESNA